jgi:amidase
MALAALVQAGETTAAELVECAIAEIEKMNPTLNAVIHQFPDLARASARADRPAGPLSGIPTLLKDTGIQMAGTPLTSGSRIFGDVVCAQDGTLAARYRKGGLLPLGRSNSPEFALSFTTEGEAFGPCRNPWDLSRTPGGSSGGSAVAVASGMVPVAHASDGAGSIRVPAAHSGVFGFKPSRMRNPQGPFIAEGIAGMSTPHAISRSVRDSAAMLDISHGADIGDPSAAPAFEGSYVAAAGRDPARLRIGMTVISPTGNIVDPACIEATQAAARLCESLGHDVEIARFDYDIEELMWAWRVIAGTGLSSQIEAYLASHPGADAASLMEPVNAEWLEEGFRWSGRDYLRAVSALHRTSRAVGRFFETYDILLSPVTAVVAPKLGEMAGGSKPLDVFYRQFWDHAPFTCVFNSSGCPAMSVPLGWPVEGEAAGLPVGVQFGAGFGNDALLFALAGQLERAQPWSHHYKSLNFMTNND